MTDLILDDADRPMVERGTYVIGYCEMVDGYRHAYEAPVGKYGHRKVVRYSRTANHPPDPRCPECHPTTTEPEGGER
jgi:hypothetical protein